MMCIRFPLSPPNVEDLLHERNVEFSHETVRFWWPRSARTDHEVAQKQWLTSWRTLEPGPIPSATCPRESVLPIRLRPDFLVEFEGYAGGAEHLPRREEARKWSLGADILRT